jgi:hypothetical protein
MTETGLLGGFFPNLRIARHLMPPLDFKANLWNYEPFSSQGSCRSSQS